MGVDEKEARFAELYAELSNKQAAFNSYVALYEQAADQERRSNLRSLIQALQNEVQGTKNEFDALQADLIALRNQPVKDGMSISEIEKDLTKLPTSLTELLGTYNGYWKDITGVLESAITVDRSEERRVGKECM